MACVRNTLCFFQRSNSIYSRIAGWLCVCRYACMCVCRYMLHKNLSNIILVLIMISTITTIIVIILIAVIIAVVNVCLIVFF